jgi:purine nucleosidase
VLDEAAMAAVAALNTPLSRFFMDINRVARRYAMENQGLAGSTHPDAIVAAMVVDPAIMTRSAHYFVDVETRGELTRGYTMVDVLGKLGRTPNTCVCLEVDGGRFRQLLLRVLATD